MYDVEMANENKYWHLHISYGVLNVLHTMVRLSHAASLNLPPPHARHRALARGVGRGGERTTTAQPIKRIYTHILYINSINHLQAAILLW